MMRLERLVSLSGRFLSERSFTLIVAPAVADFEFDGGGTPGYLAIARAVAGAIYADLTSDTSAFTFAGLVLLPAAYYAFLFALCAPEGIRVFAGGPEALTVGGVIGALSLAPAVVCYWPERRPERDASDRP